MMPAHDYVICKSCGTTNRVSWRGGGEGVRCGRCKKPLLVVSWGEAHPVDVDDQSFQREVIESALPVLLDCWAPWCGPCRLIAPLMEQLARKYQGRIKVAKLDTDRNPKVTSEYGILSIPTLLIFKNGKLVDRMVGAIPRGEIERRLRRI